MKAIAYKEYGPPDVLQFIEAAQPVPKDDEVLIKIRAASINPLDYHLMRGTPLFIRPMTGGLRKPRVTRPGVDVAGEVEAVGGNVTQFKPGDEVFGACRGAFAEYVCTAEKRLVSKPAGISFEEAAAVPAAAITALQAFRKTGPVRHGSTVLVDGASGGVGTFAIQIAKSLGAQVTAVCSTGKMDTARVLGADHIIDYTREDFTKSGRRYDRIIATNAYHSIFAYRRALNPDGIYIMIGGGGAQTLQALFLGPVLSLIGKKKMRFFIANIDRTDLVFLRDMLAAGRIVPVIDRRYPLREVPEAFRYLEEGHAKGKVIITIEHGGGA